MKKKKNQHTSEVIEFLPCLHVGVYGHGVPDVFGFFVPCQVGASSSGKSSIVRLLAELTGHTLHVLPMSSAMDTTELLGGFEQVSFPQVTQRRG